MAVLGFENVGGDADREYLSDGVAENSHQRALATPQSAGHLASTSFRFRGSDVDPRQVGRDLGVGAVLTGRVSQRGDTLVIGAELVDVAHGTQLWGERYSTRMGDLFAVKKTSPATSREDCGCSWHPRRRPCDQTPDREPRSVSTLPLEPLRAQQGHGEGAQESHRVRPAGDREGPQLCRGVRGIGPGPRQLQRHGRDPLPGGLSRSRTAATRALQLDETIPEAHSALAKTMVFLDWDWAGAERELKRALELNPGSAEAHDMYAFHLVVLGRRKEGIEHAKRAWRSTPCRCRARPPLLAYYLDRQ